MRRARVLNPLGLVVGVLGCQSYDFAFQPDTDLQQVTLDFTVQTPSQADILFVVDNSSSMTEEQETLINSFNAFIDDLSQSDTAYRIGVISTDAVGWSSQLEGDCGFAPFPQPLENGFAAKGNCDLVSVNEVAYPHDGSRGRLLAAFDTEVYNINAAIFDALSASDKAALAELLPTGAFTGPCEGDEPAGTACTEEFPPFRVQQTEGVEWVLDRALTNLNACKACGCGEEECERGNACFDGCATNVSGAYINAAFRANVRGLGIDGQGWEQGLRSGLLAIGVEPADSSQELALNPSDNLTDPTRSPNEAPNTFAVVDDVGNVFRTSWVRPEALVAIMFVTDEQDCSMSDAFFTDGKGCFEAGCESSGIVNNEPEGSVCYQTIGQANLVSPGFMSDVLVASKDNTRSRVAIGLIGGLVRPDGDSRAFATASDCSGGTEGVPDVACECITDPRASDTVTGQARALTDLRWCSYTENVPSTEVTIDTLTCDALSGDRYTSFADTFPRRTYESICLGDFSQALIDFGEIAELSCFDLNEIRPAAGDPGNIRVFRSPRELAEIGVQPVELQRVEDGADDEGWFYVPGENGRPDQICLNRIDRLIGDQYLVDILSTDSVDQRRSSP